MDISKERREQSVKFMTEGIEHTIKTFGKRAPCSEGERAAQNSFKEEMTGYMDKVDILPFKCNPDSFMGWIDITATCMILGMVLYFFAPIATVLLFAFGVFCMLSQLILYKQWIDPLFKEEQSQNVFAVKAPSGEAKRRIILCGHADAAYEWHWHYKYGCKGFYGVLAGTVVGCFYMCAIAIAKLASGQIGGLPFVDTYLWLGISELVFFPVYVMCYFYSDKKTVVDGANDNLTACFMSMAVPKMFAEENIQLKNTELCVLLTGCEEAGLRGARAFLKQHMDKIDDGKETIALCFETLRDEENLSVYKSEIFGFYKTDVKTAEFYAECAKARGKKIKTVDVSVGTDNAAFGEYGVKSTCVAALDEVKIGKYYHTRLDTYDNLNPSLLGDIFEITLDAVEKFDNQGLN